MVGKFYFFFKKMIADLRDPYRFGVSSSYRPQGYKQGASLPYGLDFTSVGMLEYYDMTTDADGVVLYPHYVGAESEETHYYSALKIAHYALACYNDLLKTEDQQFADLFLKHVDVLLDIADPDLLERDIYGWRTPSGVARYGVPKNHISGITQGLALSAISRAYVQTGNQKYLEAAGQSLPLLATAISEGGIYSESPWGVIYEEYASEPFPHIINGFLFILMGIYDYRLISKSEDAERLYNRGIKTLEALIDEWIRPHWSTYDLFHVHGSARLNLATRHYQYLHIDQLQILEHNQPSDVLRQAREKLEKQAANPLGAPRAYLNKLAGMGFYFKR